MGDDMGAEPGPLTFRPGRLEDVQELTRLDRVCFGRYAYPAHLIESVMALGHTCLVVEDPQCGDIVGFAMLMAHPEHQSGVLVTLDVEPGSRRRGVGTALVGQCARDLHDAIGDAAIWLTVASRNLDAISFYGALGFAKVRRIGGYYGDDDAIVMVHEDASVLADRAPGTA